MCKIAIEASDFPIRINGTKVHLPKETRIGLIKTLDKKKKNCKLSKAYHGEILSGSIGFVDCFGGVTFSKTIWEQMVSDLDLVLINKEKQDNIKFYPSVAS